jgi:Sec-independent protein translocase protein TatA
MKDFWNDVPGPWKIVVVVVVVVVVIGLIQEIM